MRTSRITMLGSVGCTSRHGKTTRRRERSTKRCNCKLPGSKREAGTSQTTRGKSQQTSICNTAVGTSSGQDSQNTQSILPESRAGSWMSGSCKEGQVALCKIIGQQRSDGLSNNSKNCKQRARRSDAGAQRCAQGA